MPFSDQSGHDTEYSERLISTFFEDQGRIPGIGRVQPDLVSGPVKIFQGYIILNQGGYDIPVLGLTLDLNNDITV